MSRIRKDTEAPAWVNDESEPEPVRPMYREPVAPPPRPGCPEVPCLECDRVQCGCAACQRIVAEAIGAYKQHMRKIGARVLAL